MHDAQLCWGRTNARVFMTYVRAPDAQPLTRAAALRCDPPRDTDSPFSPSLSTFSPNKTLSSFHIPFFLFLQSPVPISTMSSSKGQEGAAVPQKQKGSWSSFLKVMLA